MEQQLLGGRALEYRTEDIDHESAINGGALEISLPCNVLLRILWI